MATTPKTVRTYSLDGTKKDFTIPFEYLARKFVVVTLIGATRRELILNTEYRFTTNTTITTTKAWGPADNFDLIEIRRLTSATERLVDFADGSILRAYDLNISQVQSLHIAEEARDLTADTIGVNNDGNLDARARRIVNVGDPVDDGDVVTLRFERNWAASTLGNKIASEAARDSAINARDLANTYQGNALSYANASINARDASIAARDASITAKELSKDWSSKAEDSVVADGLYSSYHYSRKAAAQVTLATGQAALATTQAGLAATSAATATTQAGLAETAKTAAEAARDAAATSAASVAGVGRTYIDGLKMVYVGPRAITITSGSCRTPNGGRAFAANDIALASIATTVGWNHFYAYDSGSGVMAIEVSSTVPVLVSGSMYQKTGDVTRRYIGSALAAASGNFFSFRHDHLTGDVTYTAGDPGTAPFPQLGYSSVPTSTVTQSSTVAPPQTGLIMYCTLLISNGNVVFGVPEQIAPLGSGTWLTSVLAASGVAVEAKINLSRVPATYGKYQFRGVAAGVQLSMYAQGYRYER